MVKLYLNYAMVAILIKHRFTINICLKYNNDFYGKIFIISVKWYYNFFYFFIKFTPILILFFDFNSINFLKIISRTHGIVSTSNEFYNNCSKILGIPFTLRSLYCAIDRGSKAVIGA